jgi:FAD:protein FMN transferase
MASSSLLPRVERARPLLGTLVAIKLQGLPEADAHRAIDRGFAEISIIHSLMSFHEKASDVTRLNMTAHREPVAVHPHTFKVVRRAVALAADTGGVFDPTIGGHLVRWGLLPSPDPSDTPDPRASWRDIELLEENRVRFRRSLWIDLGGIAKGFAVDRAIEALEVEPETQCCVNAGGDLRVSGPSAERVQLKVEPAKQTVPIIEIENGSVASSSGYGLSGRCEGKTTGPHVDGTRRRPVGARSFVTVLAEDCMTADALTKVVLAKGPKSDSALRRENAAAYLYNARHGWRTLGVQS